MPSPHTVARRLLRLARSAPLVGLLAPAPPASAQSVVWNAIDVQSRLDNDGRLHVVETHRLELREGGGFNWARDFGLSVDQAIAFNGVTRIGPGTEEVALVDSEGDVPDRYRYYPRGHVYIAIPKVENGTEVAYRIEYELLNALQPAWAVGAGNGPLVRPPGLERPWPRIGQVLGELREAWADRDRLYRLDHDVLFPSRDGPGFVVRRIDYQIQYDTAWKLVDPNAELAQVQADQDYRVRRVFERVDGQVAPAVDRRAAWIRWAALAALFVAPPLLWLILQAAELVGARLAGPVTFETMSERLAKLAPESVKALVSGGWADPPKVEDVLARMAGERKIAIEIDANGVLPSRPASGPREDEEDDAEEDEDEDVLPARPLRMRRLVAPEGLPDLERELLQHFLVEGRREVTTQELQKLHAEHGLSPWNLLEGLLPDPNSKTRSVLAGLLWLVAFAGVALQVQQTATVSGSDLVPIVLLANLGALFLLALWPRGYWHGSQGLIPALALLVPGFLIAGAATAFLLSVNPPLGPQAFVGAALAAAAGYGAVLARSRRPWRGEPHVTVRDLGRIRGYAWRELGRARPRLDDRFVSHLEALGLGSRLEAWRRSAGSGAGEGPTVDAEEAAPLARPFTGRPTVPFAGPPGWSNALAVESADERREAEED